MQDELALVAPGHTSATVTDKISAVVLTPQIRKRWLVGLLLGFSLVMLLLLAMSVVFIYGVGVWGINIPVAWAFAITNFVWWIGIGHAGTLISAILLLLRQEWRTSINRFAEAMTLFAVTCAGIFPLIHMGRPQYFYWMLPYPTTMGLWPQFRSPLVWDFFAVSSYATVSLLFWYVGLVPDLATFRDKAKNRFLRVVYGLAALGWRGSAVHWQRYQVAYLLLAGLATPLVVSVHSVVSLDFAAANMPGWHSTIFPPYFVGGAIFSGFAMVLTLAIPLRRYYGLEDFITLRHLENMGKMLLAMGMLVSYGYLMEIFMGWYGTNHFEQYTIYNRITGPYAPAFWALITCNVLTPQLLWFQRLRRSPLCLFILAFVINVGMWLERFIIVATSLARSHLPSSWGTYVPTRWDWALFAGTIGLFSFLFLLFIRVLPMISIFEMRELVTEHKLQPATKAEADA
ncbi:MAG TPA: NrfD/PsrC family molybdoenzyme membrane anchor subunit [Planctomycetota bacterium]|jgi:molybdopterin-containing oxidoreductase family membrane subunit